MEDDSGKILRMNVLSLGEEALNEKSQIKRKRTTTMDNDIYELKDLNLYDDIYSRRRILQLRFFKRTKFQQEVIMREDGSIVLGKFF